MIMEQPLSRLKNTFFIHKTYNGMAVAYNDRKLLIGTIKVTLQTRILAFHNFVPHFSLRRLALAQTYLGFNRGCMAGATQPGPDKITRIK